MQRYLLHTSYIGSQFRGVQKTVDVNCPLKPDITTIQGCLELALKKLKTVNAPRVVISSRTDTGVHALNSTFHVDLLRHSGLPYETAGITTVLNKFFMQENLRIRVIESKQVPNDFHCRFNAKSRTYLYRFAVLKNQYIKYSNIYLYKIPIEEIDRCFFICTLKFDIEKLKQACKLFNGHHDFKTFMGKSTHYPLKNTRRKLEVNISEGKPLTSIETENMYSYWNITFKSTGFVYNQVRRIVGTLIGVGQGKLTANEVTSMLQVPSHLSWNPRVVPAPSYGLYLCQVEYSPDDLN